MSKKDVLLLGSYGRGNIGDDVFLISALQLMPDKNIYINCADDKLLPQAVRGKLKTISTTSSRDFIDKVKLFLKIKSIIYWGGDSWVLLYGDRYPRQALYKMALLNFIAKCFGKNIFYAGVGIGNLSGYDLKLARVSARLAKAIAVREERSKQVLNLKHVQVLPDLAVNLPYYSPRLHTMPAHGEKFIIAVSVLYHIHEPEKNFKPFIRSVADFINSLDPNKFIIHFLPMLISKSDSHDDLWATKQLIKQLKNNIHYEIKTSKDIEELTHHLGGCSLVIAARLHASILATYNATPSIGIPYRPKVRSFFKDNGLKDYCVDIENISDMSAIFSFMHKRYTNVAGQFYAASSDALKRRAHYEKFIGAIDE